MNRKLFIQLGIGTAFGAILASFIFYINGRSLKFNHDNNNNKVDNLRKKDTAFIALSQILKKEKPARMDSGLVKVIVMDSLRLARIIEASSSNIQISRADFIEKIYSYQNKIDYEIEMLKQEVISKKLPYRVAVTSKSYIPVQNLIGEKDLTKAENEHLAEILRSKPLQKYSQLAINGKQIDPFAQSFDIRKEGIKLTVLDQDMDGTCWAFAACGAYEISYQLKKQHEIVTSEQHVIDCSGAGTLDAGNSYKVFEWMSRDKNLDNLTSYRYPYSRKQNVCSGVKPSTDYYSSDWSLVLRNNPEKIPSIQDMKTEICKHGSLVAAAFVTDTWRHYDGNVLIDRTEYRDADNQFKTNHSILLIGWDDIKGAWLVKNSWGTKWGDRCGYGTDKGYIWIDYKSFNIGKRAAWINAR